MVPARMAESLKPEFVKLLGELHSLQQRLLSQTKAGDELRAALTKLPTPARTQQRLRESEGTYHQHIERLSCKDRSRAQRLVEAHDRAQTCARRTAELLEEAERVRQERLQARDEAGEATVSEVPAHLAELKAQVEAKASLVAELEEEMPATLKVFEENQALRRRLASLAGNKCDTTSVHGTIGPGVHGSAFAGGHAGA